MRLRPTLAAGSLPALVAASLLALVPGSARSNASSAESFHSSVSARPGERLRIDLDSGGGIELSTWDKDAVEVQGVTRGDGCSDAVLSLTRGAGDVRLESHYAKERASHSCSLTLLVHVPRRFDVTLRSSGGGFEATDLRGTMEGHTGGGSITLTGVHGVARLTTGGGEILVKDSELDGRLATGGGTVRFERVKGGVVAHSGSMRYEVRAGDETRRTQ